MEALLGLEAGWGGTPEERMERSLARWRATNAVKSEDVDRSEAEIKKKQEEAEKAQSADAPDTLKPKKPISQQDAETQNARRAERLESSGAESSEAPAAASPPTRTPPVEPAPVSAPSPTTGTTAGTTP